MTEFSERVEQVSISGIREVFEAAGEGAINLGLGQPDFPTPEHARKAAVDAIEAGKADGYTSNRGMPDLVDAIVEKHARDQGVDVAGLLDATDPEDVTDDEIEDAVAELEAVGSIEYARDLAEDLVAEGKDHLDVLPDNEAHRRLEQVADYLIERTY